MTKQEKNPFAQFLKTFIPKVAKKRLQLCNAIWLLETTNSPDAALLVAQLGMEEQLFYEDSEVYKNLLSWDCKEFLNDSLLIRQFYVLKRIFKFNQVSKPLSEEISKKEAELSRTYGNFRAEFESKPLSENDVLVILKNETNPIRRQNAWKASKQVGNILAPQILNLVSLRNQKAKELGYKDFFHMRLDMEEVDEVWLFDMFEDLIQRSEDAYIKVVNEIEKKQMERFGVHKKELGPWAWSDPFSQNDPLDDGTLDGLVKDTDIVKVCEHFFQNLGFDVKTILQKSDLFERSEKNQHAFCINMNRHGDVRILANIKQYMNWLDGLLHELGHAVYELGFDKKLPWLLREPPSIIVTEAVALLFNRQAYRYSSLCQLVGHDAEKKLLMKIAEESLTRRQLILSRFVAVLTFFERELYRNPNQDLNYLWWTLVNKFQKISIPKGRENKNDWAAKYHIGLAPVYSFSYQLGELLASSIEEALAKEIGQHNFDCTEVGKWLKARLFSQGDRMDWHTLVHYVTGRNLNPDAWIREFCES